MNTEEVHEIIKDIKSKFRLFMNGMVSQSMRERGMDYKLNFGIEYPRIKEIAGGYEPSHEVAQALWKENIRECKIMAGLLQPAETFYPEIADIWIEDMRYPELAEYTVMNLFQRLPYASDAAFRWIAAEGEYFQLCGFLLMARLLMKGTGLNERAEDEFLDQSYTALESEFPTVRRAAGNALKKLAGTSSAARKRIIKNWPKFFGTSSPEIQFLLEDIKAGI